MSHYLKIRELSRSMNESFISDYVKNNVVERKSKYYKTIALAVVFYMVGVFVMIS